MNLISIESERKSRLNQNKNEDPPLPSGTIFIAENSGDMTMNKLLIEMTNNYPTFNSWRLMNDAIQSSDPKLFSDIDAVKLIHNANSVFPNKEEQFSFIVLSVVSQCVCDILKNPFELMVNDQIFFEFLSKLPICLTVDANFELRSILTIIDIVEGLAISYNAELENDNVKAFFYQTQINIIQLISSDSYNSFVINRTIAFLDKMISITSIQTDESLQNLLKLFSNYLNSDIYSEEIQTKSMEATFHLLMQFPILYTTIAATPDYLNCIISFLSKEYTCSKYAAKILHPLLSQEDSCNHLLELKVGPALYQALNSKKSTKSTSVVDILEDIAAICETSEIGCSFFINSDLLQQSKIFNGSYKITVLILRIIHASIEWNILPLYDQLIQLYLNVIENCLESEEPLVLSKTLKVIFTLQQAGINVIDNVREQLEQISLGEFGDDISNAATALIQPSNVNPQ